MNRYRYKGNILFTGLLALCLLLPGILQSQKPKGKPTTKDLQSKKNQLEDVIKQIGISLDKTRKKSSESIAALVYLNNKIEKRQELIAVINAQIHALNAEIRQNEIQVLQLKNNLEKLKREYARMIVFAQRNQDSYTNMMFIFAAETFNQAYARLKYMQQYSEFRKKNAAEIIATQTELLKKIDELKEQRREKNILLGNEVDEKENLKKEKTEKENTLGELQKKEKELKAELEKKKKAAAQLQVAIRRMIETEIKRKNEEKIRQELKELVEKAKKKKGNESKTEEPKVSKTDAFVPALTPEAQALSASFANNMGKLPWPVERGYICEQYGEHEHPAIKGFMMVNNGVEICTAENARARAVFEGEVTAITVSPTGGKMVLIKHGEYYSVYTNLGEVMVKPGQKVNVKQVIGTILFNEDEGKVSLNLQIWKNARTMNPSDWLSRGY